MTFDEWYSKEAPPEDFEVRHAQLAMAKAAWDAAIEAATQIEAGKWRARFEWLAMQHWVEPEAAFRLDLTDTGDDPAAYMARLIAAVDARRETPNAMAR